MRARLECDVVVVSRKYQSYRLDMPSMRHDRELHYLRILRQLMDRLNNFRRMSDFELICFKRHYDWIYLVNDALDWWQKVNLEGRHRRGL